MPSIYLQYKGLEVDSLFFCFSFNCPFKISIIYIFLPCNIQWCSPWQGILTSRKLSVLVNLRLSGSGLHHFLMNGQAGWWTFADQWEFFPACSEVNLGLVLLNCQLVCCWSVSIFKQLFSNFSFFSCRPLLCISVLLSWYTFVDTDQQYLKAFFVSTKIQICPHYFYKKDALSTALYHQCILV